MARGLDIYRYQTVTDWRKVKEWGAKYIWVKLTDGNGPAIVRGDSHVRGCKLVSIPVGGYHFAQKGDPVRQARVFVAELDRLNAWGIIPALDLENNTGISWTGPEARNFAIAFLRELKLYTPGGRVALYANTSELKAMDALRVCNEVGNVVIWEANYSNNNGTRHALPANNWAPFRGAHQYTSNGRVSGINENTDLNESFVDLEIGAGSMAMELTDKIRFWDGFEITVGQALADSWQLNNNLNGRPTRPNQPADTTPWITTMFSELALIRAEQARQAGMITAQGELIRQIANDEELDLAAIASAAEAGAERGVAKSTIDVDINIREHPELPEVVESSGGGEEK